jgi:anion-transporting  ArsA/GET3 family ATPase
MKVKELKEILNKYDDELEVYVRSDGIKDIFEDEINLLRGYTDECHLFNEICNIDTKNNIYVTDDYGKYKIFDSLIIG